MERVKPTYGEEADATLRLFVTLTRCFHSVATPLKADIEANGLSVSEFGVLEMLYHKGDLPLGEVANRLLIATGSTTYVIDKLERLGLVERKACERDRRISYAHLTDKGRERIAQSFPRHAEVVRKTFSALTTEEQETLRILLKKLGLSLQNPADISTRIERKAF